MVLPTPRLVPDRLAVVPRCMFPERLSPLLHRALLLLVSIPTSSEAKILGAKSVFDKALEWWGLEATDVTAEAVLAFVVLRCAPPVDDPSCRPPPRFSRPVLATSVAGDVDALRRGARLGVLGLGAWLQALTDDRVSCLLRAIAGRHKRLKSAKKPLLFSQVEAFATSVPRPSRPHRVTRPVRSCARVLLRDARLGAHPAPISRH